jgi:hypothetical protein
MDSEPEKPPNSLQVLFRRTVPLGFIDHLVRRQEWVYQEAQAQCFKNTLWTEAEARFLVGDTERALFESEMRKAAQRFNLPWQDAAHQGGNCTYVKVSAGKFRITAHRVHTPGEFVNPCASRRQDAAVNQFMEGYVLEGSLCVPLPKLEEAEEIAIYLLHGSIVAPDGQRASFINLAAPDSELEHYQWQCSSAELKQAYLADSRSSDKDGEVRDLVQPTVRKKKKTQEGED